MVGIRSLSRLRGAHLISFGLHFPVPVSGESATSLYRRGQVVLGGVT